MLQLKRAVEPICLAAILVIGLLPLIGLGELKDPLVFLLMSAAVAWYDYRASVGPTVKQRRQVVRVSVSYSAQVILVYAMFYGTAWAAAMVVLSQIAQNLALKWFAKRPRSLKSILVNTAIISISMQAGMAVARFIDVWNLPTGLQILGLAGSMVAHAATNIFLLLGWMITFAYQGKALELVKKVVWETVPDVLNVGTPLFVVFVLAFKGVGPFWGFLVVASWMEQLHQNMRRVIDVTFYRVSAEMDGLTQVANRKAWDRELEQAVKAGKPFGVLFVDIDHFKAVNDTYGHAAGDEVLRIVAERLRSHIQGRDVVARYGGEEFGILLRDIDRASLVSKAEELRKVIAATPVEYEGRKIPVTVSIGVSKYDDDGTTEDTLLKAADQRLYQAKFGGRNLVVAWQQSTIPS